MRNAIIALILTCCIVHNSFDYDKKNVGKLRCSEECNIIDSYWLHSS